MQSNQPVSFLFAMGKLVDGVPAYDKRCDEAMSFGAGHILMILLICSDKLPVTFFMLSRKIQRSGFTDVNLYNANYNTLTGSSLSSVYEKLLTDKRFVMGDERNFSDFKRDFHIQTERQFCELDVTALANFLYLASKSQGKSFEFSWVSKYDGPAALFWLWYYSNLRKVNIENLGDAKSVPNRIIDKILWIDTVFMRAHPEGKPLLQLFEEKGDDGLYKAKRCYLSGDVCQKPVRVLMQYGNSAKSFVYFNQLVLNSLVNRLGAKAGRCRLMRGGCLFEFSLFKQDVMHVTKVDRVASHSTILVLIAFKKAFLERFEQVQAHMPAKLAVTLHLVYYSVFEYFGFNRDEVKLNVPHCFQKPPQNSRCLLM